MRKVVLFLIAMLSFSTLSSAAAAQANKLKNYNPDPNGEPWYTGLPELTPEQRVMIQQMPRLQPSLRLLTTKAAATSVDNSTNKYFRPIFNQEGGSCAQASGIGYTFTYEMAYLRDLDARISQNQYPVHYTWNFLNQGTGKGSWYFDGWDIARDNGIPDLITYGDLFTPHPYVEWMSGYDKYYAGMANRTLRYFAIDVSTPEGIETMRQYMLHHAEGEPVGGIVNLATFMDGVDYNVLAAGTPHAGETIITAFGPGNDPESGHAMTFVGYDDTVRYDYNGDGQYTNDIDINADGVVDLKDWEIGAVKLANSWGTSWKNQGFAWVMYRVLAHDRENGERGIQSKMVNGVEVKETNIPKMALKVTMTHSSRSLIRLGAGVADDVDAAVPDQQISYSLFNYQGGDWPMRGDSSDAIEIGLDVSKLYEMVGESGAKKFFLIVDENDPYNGGSGEVISLSLIDYTNAGHESVGESDIAILNNSTTYVDVVREIGSGGSGSCVQATDTNRNHKSLNRAYGSWSSYYAVGSNDFLGSYRDTTTLRSTSPDYWELGTCENDPYPPAVEITAPSDGTLVEGIVTLSADAEDDGSGVSRVVFSIPNYTLCTDTEAPYSCPWDTTWLASGSYTLTATVYDGANNSSTDSITVSIENDIDTVPPSVLITSPADGATVSGYVTATAQASDNVAVERVVFAMQYLFMPPETLCQDFIAPYTCQGDTTAYPNGTYTLTVTAYDIAGNSSSQSISVTLDNEVDLEAPYVEITEPLDGAQVSGTITVCADAYDQDSGVDVVYFYIPDVMYPCWAQEEPYCCELDVSAVPGGEYELVAEAHDVAGNVGTDSITVTVGNPVSCQQWTAKNSEHLSAARAYRSWFTYYAAGSGDRLGSSSTTTTVYEMSDNPGFFRKGTCPQ